MLVHTIRTNGTRLMAGAFVAAAVAVPLYASLTSADAAPQVTAGPACLAWFGNKEDGNCMGYSLGTPVVGGTPGVQFGGGGIGINTGPLFPGTTWTGNWGSWGG